ncbi:Cytochrome c biosynthesis protein [Actinidia chinensis var. chinensis]|uniref:Cytochrome c biosynthesis protein n=1 Tax=Actinidia chinensis var. chinensis TaxID=1590841 RepID=A0A2R6RWL4_ACTCC|nr:Cytochrome c biosynthesis protein [Actinidia chinensis var. chinensis]
MAKPNTLLQSLIFLMIACQTLSARPLNLVVFGNEVMQKNEQTLMPTDSGKNFDMEVYRPKRVGGKYGPLFLSMLPKGMVVPPSGPSRRTNDMEN